MIGKRRFEGALSPLFIVVAITNMEGKKGHHGEHSVGDRITATHQYLLTHYGPLLTLKHLAEVFHSTPSGLRMAMYRKREPVARALAQTRRQVGRRMFFEARRVAELIDRSQGEIEAMGTDQSRRHPLARPRADERIEIK